MDDSTFIQAMVKDLLKYRWNEADKTITFFTNIADLLSLSLHILVTSPYIFIACMNVIIVGDAEHIFMFAKEMLKLPAPNISCE